MGAPTASSTTAIGAAPTPTGVAPARNRRAIAKRTGDGHGSRAALAKRTTTRFPILVAVLTALIIGLEFSAPLYARDPGVRAGVETAITLTALLSAYLMLAVFHSRRRLCDLLLLIALVTLSLVDFTFMALPALSGVNTIARGAGARLGAEAVVSVAFAVAAFAPSRRLVGSRRRTFALACIAAIGVVALAGLAELVIGAHWAPRSLNSFGIAGAASYPVSFAVHALTSVVLVASGIAFVVHAEPRDKNAGLLAGASFLLAGSMLQFLAMPAIAADWVTPGAVMRMGAYSLLLVVAFRRDARVRGDVEWKAITAERQRIARDLHDGLAQDLAVIAAHGPLLLAELGPDHPLVIAAERSLATSRGAILDLSASDAATTGDALREVAEELEARFRVQVNVRVRLGRHGENDLGRVEREEVVRIAREAIVNAAQHGGARRVDVEVDYGGPDLLRVTDDGCGIAPNVVSAAGGFGLPTMRARAESIGGRLVTRRAVHGGTEIDVLVP